MSDIGRQKVFFREIHKDTAKVCHFVPEDMNALYSLGFSERNKSSAVCCFPFEKFQFFCIPTQKERRSPVNGLRRLHNVNDY